MNKTDILMINRRTNVRREGDQWLLLSPGGKLLMFNDTGRLILDSCDGTRSVDDICAHVRSVMSIPKSRKIDAAVKQFIDDLVKAQCVYAISTIYEEPVLNLRHSGGVIPVKDVDPVHFLGVGSGETADPPCQ